MRDLVFSCCQKLKLKCERATGWHISVAVEYNEFRILYSQPAIMKEIRHAPSAFLNHVGIFKNARLRVLLKSSCIVHNKGCVLYGRQSLLFFLHSSWSAELSCAHERCSVPAGKPDCGRDLGKAGQRTANLVDPRHLN